jgi:hypothetical protein
MAKSPLKTEAKVKEDTEIPLVSSLLLVIDKLTTQLQQQGEHINHSHYDSTAEFRFNDDCFLYSPNI